MNVNFRVRCFFSPLVAIFIRATLDVHLINQHLISHCQFANLYRVAWAKRALVISMTQIPFNAIIAEDAVTLHLALHRLEEG
jgi:hypothetical protein